MKQKIRYKRTELYEVELEVLQPLTRDTLTGLINASVSLGVPAQGKLLSHQISEFSLVSVEPECECQGAGGKSLRKRAR